VEFTLPTSSSRIAIIGSGAIGGFYGLMLARAGFEVHFLLRSDYQAVTERGLLVRSAIHGNLRLEKINAYRSLDDMPRCDWLLIGAKATSNNDLAPLLVKAAAPQAKILVLQNGLGIEDRLRSLLPAHLHLIGALCWVGVQRQSCGVIDHIALGDVHLGYHSGPAKDVQQQRAMLESGAGFFEAAGIKAIATADLVRARWNKLVWNIPYNGLSVLLDAGTEGLMANPYSRLLIREIMHEVIVAAAACGHSFPDELADQMISLTDSIPDYLPSMYLDNAQRRPMELHVMYGVPLDTARAAGCPMPKVEALYHALRFIEARNSSQPVAIESKAASLSGSSPSRESGNDSSLSKPIHGASMWSGWSGW
jgi:2-dehydropantoate 2-reductase